MKVGNTMNGDGKKMIFHLKDKDIKTDNFDESFEELKKDGLNKKKFMMTIKNLKFSSNVSEFVIQEIPLK